MPRVVLTLAVLAFTIYAVVDCIQTEEDRVRNLPKLAWVFLMLMFTPIGGIAWLLAGRPQDPGRGQAWRGGFGGYPLGGPQPPGGRTGPQDQPRRPRGPDDDPDFLKNL